MLHVVLVTVLQILAEVAVVAPVEGGVNLRPLAVGHRGVQPVDVDGQAYESVLGIEASGRSVLDGLHAGSRRCQHHGARSLPCAVRHQQVGVEGMAAAVQVDFQQVAVYALVRHILDILLREVYGCLAALVQFVLPERPEVLRLLGEGLNLVGREAHLHVVPVGFAVKRHLQPQVAEAGLRGRAHTDLGPSVLQPHRATAVRRQQVGADLPFHHAVARNAVLIELHLDGGLLTRLVEPVGMVGYGHPQVVAAVGIILGPDASQHAEHDEK